LRFRFQGLSFRGEFGIKLFDRGDKTETEIDFAFKVTFSEKLVDIKTWLYIEFLKLFSMIRDEN